MSTTKQVSKWHRVADLKIYDGRKTQYHLGQPCEHSRTRVGVWHYTAPHFERVEKCSDCGATRTQRTNSDPCAHPVHNGEDA